MDQILRISEKDTAGVALFPLHAGTTASFSGTDILVCTEVPAGHKIALRTIRKGEPVIKYGFPIGEATEDIPAGAHIHTHNLKTLLKGAADYTYHPLTMEPPALSEPASFFGYQRKYGRPGIRNELWILPTVGCVNDIAERLAETGRQLLREEVASLKNHAIDGVYAFSHPYGCSQLSDDQENTRQILADLAVHPNAGGVLVLGLGCENSGIEEIRKRLPAHDAARIRFLKCQDVSDELAEGKKLLKELLSLMAEDQRTEQRASELVVGLKCGGSDGFSGITANPVIGRFSDLLTAMGGTTILTEVPEMFGAETILMDRCRNRELFEKTVHLINDFKEYFEKSGMPVYENPSPGNKAGGITTLEDKALGCTQKSGTAPVMGVLSYGERVSEHGLNLLSAPGNDLVSSTALAAAGAQLILFSTGRGTPFGCPVPTLKLSSNTELASHKRSWIDFDAGRLLTGMTAAALGEDLLMTVLDTASGKTSKNEENGYRGIAIFKNGITL